MFEVIGEFNQKYYRCIARCINLHENQRILFSTSATQLILMINSATNATMCCAIFEFLKGMMTSTMQWLHGWRRDCCLVSRLPHDVKCVKSVVSWLMSERRTAKEGDLHEAYKVSQPCASVVPSFKGLKTHWPRQVSNQGHRQARKDHYMYINSHFNRVEGFLIQIIYLILKV